MKLFIFKAVGSYFGGAVGVIAETPEEAAEIVNVPSEDYKKRNKEWREKGVGIGAWGMGLAVYESKEWKEWCNAAPEGESVEPLYLEDPETHEDKFVLAHEYELTDNHEKGFQFNYSWEG